MKKVISTFFCDVHNTSTGWLKEFSIVEDCETKIKTIQCTIDCFDNIKRSLNYQISDFEYQWKINIGDLIGANL